MVEFDSMQLSLEFFLLLHLGDVIDA